MSEYARISVPYKTSIGVYQIIDEELCMILDRVTGENIRFGLYHGSVGKLEDALKVLEKYPQEDRWIIVKLSCISSHKIEKPK